MSTSTQDVIRALYKAFAAKDGPAMAACYSPDASFSDPVFPNLMGKDVGAMWTMLCKASKDLQVSLDDVQVNGDTAQSRWVARYPFSRTGRMVENHITGRYTVKNGKIVSHVDDFDFWAWSRMALGTAGVLLGWTPLLKNKVRAQAAASLAQYKAKNP